MTVEQAYVCGAEVASAYKKGDLFWGAIPECEKFDLTGEERAAFINGYLANLARPVVTDYDNVIVGLGIT